jgi:hypothetical protein
MLIIGRRNFVRSLYPQVYYLVHITSPFYLILKRLYLFHVFLSCFSKLIFNTVCSFNNRSVTQSLTLNFSNQNSVCIYRFFSCFLMPFRSHYCHLIIILIAGEAGTEFNVKIGLLVGQCSYKTVQFNFMLYSPKRRAVWSCL